MNFYGTIYTLNIYLEKLTINTYNDFLTIKFMVLF